MSAPILDRDLTEKQDVSHVEIHEADDKIDPAQLGGGLMKSPIDDISIWKTLWIFKRVFFFVVLVYTGYVCEGFEVCDLTIGSANISLVPEAQSSQTRASSNSSVTALRPE